MQKARARLAVATLLASAATFSVAVAQESDFYKGKTINIVVGFSAGGGYDIYARMLARHIGNHIPGAPLVVVQNMPGAASRRAIQYLDTAAPSDGTVILTFNFGQITSSMVLPPENMHLDFRNFAWIGSMNQDVSVCYVWRERFPGVRNALDLAKSRREVIYGITGVGSASYFNQAMTRTVFDVNLKQVRGYPGSKDKQIAIERGELDGDCGEWSSVPEEWVRGNRLTFLMRSSKMIPDDMPPDVPWAEELAETNEKRQMVRLLTAASDVGRPYVTRRDVPAARVQILRAAFNKAMSDPAMIAESKQTRRPISPMTGEEAAQAIEELYKIPESIVAKTRAALPPAEK